MNKSTIRTRVNQICRRSETDIDAILLEALTELSERYGLLVTDASGTLTSAGSFTAPTDLAGRMIWEVWIDTDKPLTPITYSQYKKQIYAGYALHNGTVYVYPAPSAGQTYHINYSKLDDDVDSIEHPDKYLR